MNDIYFAISTLSNSQNAAQEPSTLGVVFTGLTLVFGILVVLTFLLHLQGKFFSNYSNKNKKEAPAPTVVETPAEIAPELPVIQEGIPEEVVAAIAAVVANLENGKYTLRSVSVASTGQNPWALAGNISNTNPF